ncbi:MAG: DUF4263 domain-containing protein [Burkholderiales bacterium]|nr:DUF4263 domain-containing protein [Burkholderiales bacterium]
MKRPAIEFVVVGNKLRLIYRPHDGTQWVYRKFKSGGEVILKGTFHLTRANLVQDDVDDWVDDADYVPRGDPDDFEFGGEDRMDFLVANAGRGEYFRFSEDVLPVGVDVLLHHQARPTWKWFSAEKKTSVLDVVAKLKPSRIVIGGPEPDAIPVADYERLIDQFPSSHELKRYVLARVSSVVREYTDASVDAKAQLRKTVDRKVKGTPKDLAAPFRAADVRKYEYLLKHLNDMLAAKSGAYKEAHWQDQIIKIICLLNPKYIEALTGVRVKDFDGGTWRILDILLVDASGNVDVLEIKQPFGEAMVTGGLYRDNHVPLRELSGTVIQVEKYLLHLSRWGVKGEEILTKRYASLLPPTFKIRVVNPSGLIIMGRDRDMTRQQRHDFEVVRRHYKHIADIVTYDDLVRRLEAVLTKLRAAL